MLSMLEYCPAIREKRNLVICNMDGARECNAKRNKRKTKYDFTHEVFKK